MESPVKVILYEDNRDLREATREQDILKGLMKGYATNSSPASSTSALTPCAPTSATSMTNCR